MSNYGVQPTGYVRKPLSTILAELEAAMITEFGPGVIQTPQSPLGQLNGLMADLLAEVDEHNLDLYQSYDPDQAEGTRLETLARLRLIQRGLMNDTELRQAITNAGNARVDIQDLVLALRGLSGVTYAQVFVNDSGESANPELERGFVAAAVIDANDQEIATVLRSNIVPGVSTYRNVYVTSVIDGYCRSMSIIRPISVQVNATVTVRQRRDRNGCPAPSVIAMTETLINGWLERRQNGMDVTAYQLRNIIECAYNTVEFVSFTAFRDNNEPVDNQDVIISFVEIADLNVEVLVL